MIITITNQKGGVAKTTTAVSLAHGLAIRRPGLDHLLLDFDQQGHCATALGMRAESCLFDWLVSDAPRANCIRETGRDGLLLLPGDARTKHVDLIYRNERDGFDRLTNIIEGLPFDVVVDTPSDGLLQEAAISVADWVIIPARPEALSIAGVHDTMALCRRINPMAQVVILPVMYDKRVNEHAYNLGLLQEMAKRGGDTVSPPPSRSVVTAGAIPARIAVAEAHGRGKTIWEYEADGIVDVRAAYAALLDLLVPSESHEVQP